jgi:ATP adenylyltransferase
MAYVTGANAVSGCVFCDAAAEASGAAPGPAADGADQIGLIVHRGRHAFVILNLYPYTNGHLMVVPHRHVASLGETERDELAELFTLTRRAEMALLEAYAPQGLNIGVNVGKAAGAGVADHLHIHLVPRWAGDTNFMTVIGQTRVLPETLDQSAARLTPIFARLAAE